MAYYIIIRGPLGIGKTTIADKLARELNGIHISIDKTLRENGLNKIEGDSIPMKNFIKANEIILNIAKKDLREGKIIIFDGNF